MTAPRPATDPDALLQRMETLAGQLAGLERAVAQTMAHIAAVSPHRVPRCHELAAEAHRGAHRAAQIAAAAHRARQHPDQGYRTPA